MTPEEKASLMKMFESVSEEIAKDDAGKKAEEAKSLADFPAEGTDIPDGMTRRLKLLKENYLKQKPSITTYRARAITKIAKENPGMPKIELRAKCFRYCCETAPLVIQDNELIVGAPCGAPRAGAFSPDIAWRWMVDEIDTIGTRPQDPFYIQRKTRRSCARNSSRSGRANLLTSTARISIARLVSGSCPASPSYQIVPTMQSTAVEIPTRVTT